MFTEGFSLQFKHHFHFFDRLCIGSTFQSYLIESRKIVNTLSLSPSLKKVLTKKIAHTISLSLSLSLSFFTKT